MTANQKLNAVLWLLLVVNAALAPHGVMTGLDKLSLLDLTAALINSISAAVFLEELLLES